MLKPILTVRVRHRAQRPHHQRVAAKHKVSPAQIILSWHVARGVSIVPRSHDEQRQKDNLDVRLCCHVAALPCQTTDCSMQLPQLDTEDMERISALDRNQRVCNFASERGKVGGWTYEQLGW